MGVAMAIIAPKGRTHLSADALCRLVRSGFATIPEHRSDEVDISFTDALMSGFAMFSLTSPTLLAFDKQRVEGNLETIYGMPHEPCDTRMRERLDPVSPESLRASFTSVLRQLQRGKALEEMVLLDGYSLLALDGTGDFSSQTMHCDSCLHKVHRHGAITYYHQLLGAAMLHPDRRAVIPLMPEPSITQDGTEKNDGERHAAKRFMNAGTKILTIQKSPPADAAKLNQVLIAAERALLSKEGLPNRPWFKHTIYAPGQYTGYAAVVIPGVNEAIDAKNAQLVTEQLQILTDALNRAAGVLEAYQ